MDTVSKERRSEIMARIRSTGTTPEMTVRRLVHRLGYRYRLHTSSLPGKPDLVFASRRKVIFVNGCFWHSHRGCPAARIPKSRKQFWTAKLDGNVRRDAKVRRRLSKMGWKHITIWECEVGRADRVESRILAFLGAATCRGRQS